jgi:hypothetical protein
MRTPAYRYFLLTLYFTAGALVGGTLEKSLRPHERTDCSVA